MKAKETLTKKYIDLFLRYSELTNQIDDVKKQLLELCCPFKLGDIIPDLTCAYYKEWSDFI